MRPIQPRVEAEFTAPAASPKPKHRLVACMTCRSRKVACDGTRPICKACEGRKSECHYPTRDESETRRQALMRENKSFADLIKALSTAPPVTAQAILYDLRQSSDPLSVVRRYETGQLLGSTAVTLPTSASIPRMCSVAELKMMLRHPMVYPALDLSYDAILSKRTLVEDAGSTGPSDKDQELGLSTKDKGNSIRQYEARRVSDSSTSTPSRMADSSTSVFLAPLMDHLRIQHWTNVPVTDRYAAAAISLYLEGDHQLLNLFDASLFLNDLIHLRSNYCSPFLVNSVLAMASQTYSGHDSIAAARSLEFEQEAQLLWRTDPSDSVSNLAGLMLLFIAIGSNGNADSGAAGYVSEASEMAKRMRLFGVKDRITAIQLRHFNTDEEAATDAQQAHSQTAWGVFNAYNMGVHLGVAPPQEYPPTLATPQPREGLYFKPVQRRFSHTDTLTSPRYEAFRYSCELNSIDLGTLLVLRNLAVKQPPPLAFAYASNTPASVLYMHSCFHQIVTDLFRPYASERETYVHTHHPDFGSPRDIFRASAQQLKALVLEFISKPKMVFQTVMWHTTLLYAANAVLEDTTHPAWRWFYLLIINCYSKLYQLYPLAESAVQSLLNMATARDAISLSEARNIFSTTILIQKAGKLQLEYSYQKNIYVADLTRATSDREAAATASLAKKFEEVSMSEESAEDLLESRLEGK